MKNMYRTIITTVLVLLCQLLVVGCRPASPGPSPESAFLEAAKAAGAPIRSDEIVTSTTGNHIFSIAPITTWEQTPATALPGGVNIAFVYLSTPTETVGQGYYTLRASAEVTKIGPTPARIELIDRQGNVAGKLAATTEVHSLAVPERASTRRTFVTVRDEPRTEASNLPKLGPIRVIVLCCPNGECFIFILL
jgi:hypothetical protein